MPYPVQKIPPASAPTIWLAIALTTIAAACGQQEGPSDAAETLAVDSDGGSDSKECDRPYAAGPTPTTATNIDPTVCFRGAPPAPGEAIAELPMPDASCCADQTPIFFKPGQPVPPATLTVELGTSNSKTGAFVPYAAGQWLRIAHGKQGGIHVDAAFRVALAGEEAPKVKMQVFARGHFECKESAIGNSPIVWVRQDAELDFGYTNASPIKPGVQVRFPVTGGYWYRYCGIWLDLRLAVRHPGSGAWGHTSTMVRLYDGVLPKNGHKVPPP